MGQTKDIRKYTKRRLEFDKCCNKCAIKTKVHLGQAGVNLSPWMGYSS